MSTLLALAEQVEDLRARLARVIQVGRIDSVDYTTATARVKIVETLTTPRPWLTRRAAPGGDRDWWAPETGEQVLLLAPSGDLTAAVILPSLYQDSAAEPADRGTVHRTLYADGAVIDYDRAAHTLSAVLPAGGRVIVTAPDRVAIETGDAVVTANTVLVQSDSIDLAASGGPAVARIGDEVAVGAGSSAGRWPIVSGSSRVRSA